MPQYLVTFSDGTTAIAEGTDSFDARHKASLAHNKSPMSADLILEPR